MDEMVEYQVMLDEILQHQEVILQEYFYASRLEYSSLIFTNNEIIEEAELC